MFCMWFKSECHWWSLRILPVSEMSEVFYPVNLTRSELMTLISACDDRDIKLYMELDRLQRTTGTSRDKIDLLSSYRFKTKAIRRKLVASQAATTIRLNKAS